MMIQRASIRWETGMGRPPGNMCNILSLTDAMVLGYHGWISSRWIAGVLFHGLYPVVRFYINLLSFRKCVFSIIQKASAFIENYTVLPLGVLLHSLRSFKLFLKLSQYCVTKI